MTAKRGRDTNKAIKLIIKVGLLLPAVTYVVEVALAVAVAVPLWPAAPAEEAATTVVPAAAWVPAAADWVPGAAGAVP